MPRLHRPNRNFLLVLLAAGLIAPQVLRAQEIIRVPGDRSTLQDAIVAVHEGGIIEMAAGNYTAPSGGFTIYDMAKGFTIRAGAGGAVVLSGGGTRDIIRFGNPSVAAGRPVTFQGLTFSNGLSTTDFIGGVFTVTHAEAIFVSCTFENNAATPAASSGVLWLYDAVVSFQQCTFTNNSSRNYGGAISAVESRVFLRGCSFIGNRVNVPNHTPSSVGGAIFDSNSSIHADNCRFENNQASYVAGAIYCGGAWKDPLSQPSAELVISNSIFAGNFAARDPAVPFGGAPLGGAIHLEDQATGKFVNCRFENNHAVQAGAISNYRAVTEVTGCVFKGNYVTGAGPGESIGGSIFVMSADGVDSSTNYGHINRRSASLTVSDSFFLGQADGSSSALEGGAIFVSGDLNAAFGNNGVTQNGTEESNRASLSLTRVVFADLTTSGVGSIPGSAGALAGSFVTLSMDTSIVENCSTSGLGGALQLGERSFATITNSTIARCRAGSLGGGMAVFATDLHMTGTNLLQNQTTGNGNGAAMVAGPVSAGNGVPIATDMTGLVENCVFANNSGGTTIYDSDGTSAPFNRIQYGSNRFFPGDRTTYFNDLGGPRTVAELNVLTIPRAGGTATIKAPTPDVALTSAPVVGAILMVPPTILQSGAPGETLPIPSYLGYASNGGNAALDGAPQANSSGVVPTSVNGGHTLTVGSSSFATVPPPGAALNISTRLPVGTGQNVLIGGFIIQGPVAKTVMIRAIGPSLPIPGALQDPVLELHDGIGATIATNDNWRSTQIGGVISSGQDVDIQASTIAPLNDAESAIIAALSPGAYTAVVRGANNSTGIALVEGYDLDADKSSKLANISTRGFIQTADNVMIGGFILGGGTGATRVVVRGIGPSLGAFGITNPLVDPMLELHDTNGAIIDANDDWRTNQAVIQSTGLQPTNDAESALLLSNPAPGAYTAILRGKNNGTGVGVVEAYVFQ
jgi:predicted outer membrane repeat protein